MDIKHVGTDGARGPARTQRTVDPVAASRPASPVTAARRDEDRIEISAEARALAEAGRTDTPLSAEQIASLRQWVESGEFDRPEVLDVVARQMLKSGDL